MIELGLEAVLFRLHARVVRGVASVVSSRWRAALSAALVLLAFASLSVFALLHLRFVAPYGPPQCIVAQVAGALLARDGAHVLRIRVLPPGLEPAALERLRSAVAARVGGEGRSAWRVETEMAEMVRRLPRGSAASAAALAAVTAALSAGAPGVGASSFLFEQQPEVSRRQLVRGVPLPSYLFAHDRGLLALSAPSRDQLGVTLHTLDLSSEDPCLGEPLTRGLLQRLVGYDMVIINALLAAAPGGASTAGYVQVEQPAGSGGGERVHALSHAHDVPRMAVDGLGTYAMFKAGTFLSAVFLLFATSSLASFILAATQQRMLRFTVELHETVRARRPLAPLVAAHLLESLAFVPLMLGVLFFLFEFFGDQLLAFLLTLLVWSCELWSILACRTALSLTVFPRVFGASITSFHVYCLTFPFGYKYVALASVVSALSAAAWILWDTCELPALLRGDVSGAAPRAPEVARLLMPHHSVGVMGGGGARSGGQPHSGGAGGAGGQQQTSAHSSPERAREGIRLGGGSPGRGEWSLDHASPSGARGGSGASSPGVVLSQQRPRQFSLEEERILLRRRVASGNFAEALDTMRPPPAVRRGEGGGGSGEG